MGTKTTIVPNAESPDPSRQSTFRQELEGEEATYKHAQNLSSTISTYSKSKPGGTFAGRSPLPGSAAGHFERSTSSPGSGTVGRGDHYNPPSRSESIGLNDSGSAQAIGDEANDSSHMVLGEGSIDLKKSISMTSSSSDGRKEYANQFSWSSQSTQGSNRRGSGKDMTKVYEHYQHLRRQESEFMRQQESEIKQLKSEIKSLHEALQQCELVIQGLRKENETLQKKSDLLDKDVDKQSDSYFQEVIGLTEQLSACQAEVGKLKLGLLGYDELKRRSKFLEEQASVASEMLLKQPEGNQAVFAASIQGTEGLDVSQGDVPGISSRLQVEYEQREQEAQREIEDLKDTLEKKNETIKKLKDRFTEATAKLTEARELRAVDVDISGDRIYKDRLLEAEAVIEGLQSQLAKTGTAAEPEADRERLREELQDMTSKYKQVLRGAEILSEQSKTIKESLTTKEIKFQEMRVSCVYVCSVQ